MPVRNPVGEAIKRVMQERGLSAEDVAPLIKEHKRELRAGTLRARLNEQTQLDPANVKHRKWIEDIIEAIGGVTFDEIMRRAKDVAKEGDADPNADSAMLSISVLLDPQGATASKEFAARNLWRILKLPETELEKLLKKLFENVA